MNFNWIFMNLNDLVIFSAIYLKKIILLMQILEEVEKNN